MQDKYLQMIQNVHPITAFRKLRQARKQTLRKRISATRSPNSPEFSNILSDAGRLVNPILLSTAISISLVTGQDFKQFLKHYVETIKIPDFDETLIKIPDIFSDEQLKQILETEIKYIDAIIALGAEIFLLINNKYNPGSLTGITTFYSYFSGKKVELPTIYDIYWGSWLSVNPGYEGLGVATLELGNEYGHEMNSTVHNAREYYEYTLNNLNKDINNILNQSSSTEKITMLTSVTKKQYNATLLNKRAYRLYVWLPHELDAHAVGVVMTPKLLQDLSEAPNRSLKLIALHALADYQVLHDQLLSPDFLEEQLRRLEEERDG
ncbi:MAG TPA: hypothetical protein VGD69_17565 [Herpetosiphonaceae bacterium]